MILSAENYYTDEANAEYMSVSQYKEFAGTLGYIGCEEKQLAVLRGDWKEKTSMALLASSYVDAFFEGSLDIFKIKHPEIFTKADTLRADFNKMEDIIKRIQRDEYFLKCLNGERQRIFTGDIFGVAWKGKMDVYIANRAIVDLKVMKSIRETFYVKDHGRISFVEYYGYDIQAAIYQKLVEINTGKRLPFLIAVASKEEETDIEVICFDQPYLDKVLQGVFLRIGRINDLKIGKVLPTRCESCDYCHATKVLKGPIHFKDLTS